jgi:hypothetical protein
MLAEKLSEYLRERDKGKEEDHDCEDDGSTFDALSKAIKDGDSEDGLEALKAIIYQCIDDHKTDGGGGGGGLMIAIGKK